MITAYAVCLQDQRAYLLGRRPQLGRDELLDVPDLPFGIQSDGHDAAAVGLDENQQRTGDAPGKNRVENAADRAQYAIQQVVDYGHFSAEGVF